MIFLLKVLKKNNRRKATRSRNSNFNVKLHNSYIIYFLFLLDLPIPRNLKAFLRRTHAVVCGSKQRVNDALKIYFFSRNFLYHCMSSAYETFHFSNFTHFSTKNIKKLNRVISFPIDYTFMTSSKLALQDVFRKIYSVLSLFPLMQKFTVSFDLLP